MAETGLDLDALEDRIRSVYAAYTVPTTVAYHDEPRVMLQLAEAMGLVAQLRCAREVADADLALQETATPDRIERLNRARAVWREAASQP